MPSRADRILNQTKDTGRTLYKQSKPIALLVMQEMKTVLLRLDKRLDHFVKGRAPRSRQILIKTVVRVSVVIVGLYFLPITLLIFAGWAGLLASKAFLRLRGSRKVDYRRLPHREDDSWTPRR